MPSSAQPIPAARKSTSDHAASLIAGAALRRWFWLGLQAGTLFGVGLVRWLIFQSLYRIGALCPYCMIVWVVTITVFRYVTLHNLTREHLPVPARARPAVAALARLHTSQQHELPT